VLPLILKAPSDRPLSILAIGAHPDDIEIGAGGMLLTLAERMPGLRVRYVVLTGTEDRQLEARNAANAFLPAADVAIELHDLPEGRLPAVWGKVKEVLEGVARSCSPDVIIAPLREDAHQDHRTIAEIVPTVFRDQLYLAYEIPKWDGDLGRPSMHFPLSPDVARRKVELLHKVFPSQRNRDWWDDDIFLGLARLRGIECRATYAEAFVCTKSLLNLDADASPMFTTAAGSKLQTREPDKARAIATGTWQDPGLPLDVGPRQSWDSKDAR
jgi:LmbE family N-acetylglucosaminyl deacetylase